MVFDTDIFIWAQRGNNKAAGIIDTIDSRYLSVQSYMELLQGARNKKQHQYIKNFLFDFTHYVAIDWNYRTTCCALYRRIFLVSGKRTGDCSKAHSAR